MRTHKTRLAQGERIVEVLKQDRNAPVDVAYQVCILYAVIGGYLKDVPVERIREFELELYPWMESKRGRCPERHPRDEGSEARIPRRF